MHTAKPVKTQKWHICQRILYLNFDAKMKVPANMLLGQESQLLTTGQKHGKNMTHVRHMEQTSPQPHMNLGHRRNSDFSQPQYIIQ
jgi:hypothetical protein